MCLEPLELVERRQGRVLIVEMNDETDGNEPVAVVIQERAAGRAGGERPPERVLNEPRLELVGRNLPQLLQADSVFLRPARRIELVPGDRLFGQRSSCAFGEQDVLPLSSIPRVKLAFGWPSRPTPMSPVATPTTSPLSPNKKLGRRETRINLDAKAFRARPQPARERAKRTDKIAMVVHQPRHRPVRQFHSAGRGHEIEVVFAHLRLKRAFRGRCASRGSADRGRSDR